MRSQRRRLNEPKPFRVQDVANKWGVSKQTIIKAIKRGDLHAFRLGGLFLIPPASVERFERGDQTAA